MRDFATSDHPQVQAQLDRLAALSLPQGRIGIEAIGVLLARLGDPHRHLPPTFHVAGTNGKGSVCAFLRAMMEAEGLAVHATTSPHLVRYNERIRISGKLIEDGELAALLKEVLDTANDLPISFFEATIAASFLAFARHPADACVIEVGLGGRFDATNVLEKPAASGIATLGIDHEAFLLAPEAGTPELPLARIAFEKAGIMKQGTPVVTMAYPPEAEQELERAAAAAGAPLQMRGKDWDASISAQIDYRDSLGALTLPLPALPGTHQADNAALAIAMLRHQDRVTVSPEAMAQGIRDARWPARLQLLGDGPLTALAPGRDIWLDGGHNPDAGAAIARHFAGQRLHLVLGMLANKNPRAIAGKLEDRIASLQAVTLPSHESHEARAYGQDANPAQDISSALTALPDDGLPVLIAGSLYLAGEVLQLNAEQPD
ncbi:MAG: bifunctional folylpolyglutamate synthase/dihydrofolate synthase [Novosphingobium sp.]|nr:bifunctional folylpolyglutamate synthase/dihydrofolate synthase [Novosphingobium sp.]